MWISTVNDTPSNNVAKAGYGIIPPDVRTSKGGYDRCNCSWPSHSSLTDTTMHLTIWDEGGRIWLDLIPTFGAVTCCGFVFRGYDQLAANSDLYMNSHLSRTVPGHLVILEIIYDQCTVLCQSRGTAIGLPSVITSVISASAPRYGLRAGVSMVGRDKRFQTEMWSIGWDVTTSKRRS